MSNAILLYEPLNEMILIKVHCVMDGTLSLDVFNCGIGCTTLNQRRKDISWGSMLAGNVKTSATKSVLDVREAGEVGIVVEALFAISMVWRFRLCLH